MAKRKSRAKWQSGMPFRSLTELLGYVREHEAAGIPRKNIMVYGPWADGHTRNHPRGNEVERPTSVLVLFNMPFAVVEMLCCYARLWRAERREKE